MKFPISNQARYVNVLAILARAQKLVGTGFCLLIFRGVLRTGFLRNISMHTNYPSIAIISFFLVQWLSLLGILIDIFRCVVFHIFIFIYPTGENY